MPDKDSFFLKDIVLDPDVIDVADLVKHADKQQPAGPGIVVDKDAVLDIPDVAKGVPGFGSGVVLDGSAIPIDVDAVSLKENLFGGEVPEFVAFHTHTVPSLRVSHGDTSGRPDIVYRAGEDTLVVTVVNGHFAPAPGASAPQVDITGVGTRITAPQPRTGDTEIRVPIPAGTPVGAYTITTHAAFGPTVLPAEVALPVTASFGVVDTSVRVAVVLRDPTPVTGPGDSTTRRLGVELPAGVLASEVQIDPASLVIVVTPLPGRPMPAGMFSASAAPGTAAGAEMDVTFRFPPGANEVTMTVRGVMTVRGMRHEFEATPAIAIQRITVTNLAQRVAGQFLSTLRIALPLEPLDGNVRAYVPGIPVVPVLTGTLVNNDGAPLPALRNAITSLTNTLPLPGAATPQDVLQVDLGVQWAAEGVPFGLTRSPLDSSTDPLTLDRLDVAIVPVPTGASWFDPLAGSPDRGALPQLTLRAVVSPTVSAPSLGLPPTALDPITVTLPNPIAVGLPVPELVALYRAPDMAPDWAGAATPSHGDGAVAIITRITNGAPAFDNERHLVAPVNEPDPLPGDVRRVVSLAPGSGLGALGGLGDLLALLTADPTITVPGGLPLNAGLGRITELAAPPGSPLAAALAPILGLLATVKVLAASLTRLVAQTSQKDPSRPDTYIRLMPGAGANPMNLDTPFIRHSSIWTGTDVHIQDETESLVLLGGPASAVTLFCDPNQSGAHGSARFSTAGGFCCLEARFDRVVTMFSGPGLYPTRPLGSPAPATAPPGATFGTVSATGTVDPTSGIRLGGPGQAFDQSLARSVSSLAFG